MVESQLGVRQWTGTRESEIEGGRGEGKRGESYRETKEGGR